MREVTAPGRWVWVLAGLVTAAVLAVSGTRLIDSAWLWLARAAAGHQRQRAPDTDGPRRLRAADTGVGSLTAGGVGP